MTTSYDFLLSRLDDIATQAEQHAEDGEKTYAARERYELLGRNLRIVLAQAREEKESAVA